jgi:hypothetical protein
MFGGMSLNAPTVTLLVSVSIIVVFCVAFPKVRRTILGVVSTLDAIEALFYVAFGLAIACIAIWGSVYYVWRLLSGLL